MAEKMRRKRVRRAASVKLSVYEVPDQSVLDKYSTWAIVRQHPDEVKKKKALNEDPGRVWWVPINWQAIHWRDVFWLDPVQVKINNTIWPNLCRACDLQLPCAADGRGINTAHECTAKRENLVDIQKRPRKTADAIVSKQP